MLVSPYIRDSQLRPSLNVEDLMSSPLLQVEAARPIPLVARSSSATLLKEFSETLAGVTPASRLEVRPAPETASSGIAQIDALTGGLPRGCLTEVCGPESSGRTTVMLAAIAAVTRREEICALIDASDAFDPHSAAAAGVNLERLLWVRCGSHAQSSALSRKRRQAFSLEERARRRMEDPVEQALRATDLLLQSSGFGMVAIDLAGVPLKMARRIPLTTWFRFRRAVENTPTLLLVTGTQACAQSCASLSLELSQRSSISRQSPVVSRQEKVLSSRFSVLSKRQSSEDRQDSCDETSASEKPSHAELLTGIEVQIEVLRSRMERKPVKSVGDFTAKAAWTA
jgi:recombination protein RecA